MNTEQKNKQQNSIISEYNNKLQQIVDAVYSSFLSNHSMVDFKKAIENHADRDNGILSEIKNHFLLDKDQKDNLFTHYYNLLMDGLENVQDINERKDIRKIVFNQLKDKQKQIFSNAYILLELINDKFKAEMDEMMQQVDQEIKQGQLKQRLAEKQQLGQVVLGPMQKFEQSDAQENKIQLEQNINQDNKYNTNKQVNTLLSGEMVHDNNVDNNTYYRSNNIFDRLVDEQKNAYAPQPYAYNLQQQVGLQDNASNATFSPDDFYRYKNISNMITSSTKTLIDNEYNFVRNEIKNSKMKQHLHYKSSKENTNNLLSVSQRDRRLLMNLLMQQQKLNKNNFQQAYNKNDKYMKNSIGLIDDKIVDKNNLNSNTLGQQQI